MYKQRIDKWYIVTIIICEILFLIQPILGIVWNQNSLIYVGLIFFVAINTIMLPPMFGYVRLEENGLFISFGLIHKKILYSNIKSAKFYKTWATNNPCSITTSFAHIDIQHSKGKQTTISIKNHEEFLAQLEENTKKDLDQI